MIAIVDYGLGNIESVKYALDRLGASSVVTSAPGEFASAGGVILPGVGAFSQAMANLRELGLETPLREAATGGRPFLGICLGLQLLFDESEEHGRHEGLGILPGKVVRFPAPLKVPQMGWNQLRQERSCPLFEGVGDGAWFYFAHSYRAVPAEADTVAGTTDYGGRYASVVQRQRVFAVQFHPEKSGPTGLRMLEDFVRLCGKG